MQEFNQEDMLMAANDIQEYIGGSFEILGKESAVYTETFTVDGLDQAGNDLGILNKFYGDVTIDSADASLNNFSIYDDDGDGTVTTTTVTGSNVYSQGNLLIGFRPTADNGDAVDEPALTGESKISLVLDSSVWMEEGSIYIGHDLSAADGAADKFAVTGDGFFSHTEVVLKNGSRLEAGSDIYLGEAADAVYAEGGRAATYWARKEISINDTSMLRYGNSLNIEVSTFADPAPVITVTSDLSGLTGVVVWIYGGDTSAGLLVDGKAADSVDSFELDAFGAVKTDIADGAIRLNVAGAAGWELLFDGKNLYAYNAAKPGSNMAVNADWAGKEDKALVLDDAGTGYIFGVNAFAALDAAAEKLVSGEGYAGEALRLYNYTITEDTEINIVLTVENLQINGDAELTIAAGKTLEVGTLIVSKNLTVVSDEVIRLDSADTVVLAAGVTMTVNAAQLRELAEAGTLTVGEDAKIVLTGKYTTADLTLIDNLNVTLKDAVLFEEMSLTGIKDLSELNNAELTDLTGTSGNDTVNLNKSVTKKVNLHYNIDLLGGSNTVTVGAGRTAEVEENGSASLVHVTKLTLAADAVLYLGGGTLKMSAGKTVISAGNNTEFTAAGGISGEAGTSLSITVGTGSQFTAGGVSRLAGLTLKKAASYKEAAVFRSAALTGTAGADKIDIGAYTDFESGAIDLGAGKNTFTVGSAAKVTIGAENNMALSGMNSVKISDGAKAAVTVIFAGNAKTPVYYLTSVTIDGGFKPQENAASSFSTGAYTDVKVNGAFGSASDTDTIYGITFSVGTNGKFTAAGNMTGITKLNIRNGSGSAYYVCNDAGKAVLASAYGRTVFNIGENTISGTRNNDKFSIGANTDFVSGAIDFGTGKNTLSVASGSDVETGTLSGITSMTVTGSKVIAKEGDIPVYADTSVLVFGDFGTQKGAATSLKVFGFADMSITGNYGEATENALNGKSSFGSSVTVGANGKLEINGTMSGISSLDIQGGKMLTYVERVYSGVPDAPYYEDTQYEQDVTEFFAGSWDMENQAFAGTDIAGTAGKDTFKTGDNVRFTSGNLVLGTGADSLTVGKCANMVTGSISAGEKLAITVNSLGKLYTGYLRKDEEMDGKADPVAAEEAVGNIAGLETLTVNAGVSETETTFMAVNGNITGTAGKDTVSVKKFAELQVSGDIDLGRGTNYITVDTNGKISLNDLGSSVFFEDKLLGSTDGQMNYVTVNKSAELAVAGNMGSIASLTVNSDTEIGGLVTGTEGNDTVAVGDDATLTTAGSVVLGKGKDTLKIGKNASLHIHGDLYFDEAQVTDDKSEDTLELAAGSHLYVYGDNVYGLNKLVDKGGTIHAVSGSKVAETLAAFGFTVVEDIDASSAAAGLELTGDDAIFSMMNLANNTLTELNAEEVLPKLDETDEITRLVGSAANDSIIVSKGVDSVLRLTYDVDMDSGSNTVTVNSNGTLKTDGNYYYSRNIENVTALKLDKGVIYQNSRKENIQGRTTLNLYNGYIQSGGGKCTYSVGDYADFTALGGIKGAANGGTENYITVGGVDTVFSTGDIGSLAELKIANAAYAQKQTAFTAGDMTGTAGNNSISIGSFTSFTSGAVNLMSGKNTLTVGASAAAVIGTVEEAENISGISTGTVSDSSRVAYTIHGSSATVPVYVQSSLTVYGDYITAENMNSAFTAGKYTAVNIGGSFGTADDASAVFGNTLTLKTDAKMSITGNLCGIAKLDIQSGSNATYFYRTVTDAGVRDELNSLPYTSLHVGQDIFGTVNNDTITVGTKAQLTVNGSVDLGGGTNTITVNSDAVLQTGAVSGISTMTVNGGTAYKWTRSDKQVVTVQNITEVVLKGSLTMMKDAATSLTLKNYAYMKITGGLSEEITDEKAAVGISVTLGTDSTLDISGAVNGLRKLDIAAGSGKDYNITEGDYPETRSGETVFNAGNITGTAGNDSISIKGGNIRFTAGNIAFGAGVNTFAVGANAENVVVGNLSAADGSLKITAGKNSVLTAGTITDLNSLKLEAGASLSVAGGMTGTAMNDTVTLGADAVLVLSGNLNLGGGANTLTLGAGASLKTEMTKENSLYFLQTVKIADSAYDSGAVLMAGDVIVAEGNKNTFTTGKFSSVTITSLLASEKGSTAAVVIGANSAFTAYGALQSVSGFTVKGGSAYKDNEGVQTQGWTTVTVKGDITGTAGNNKVDIGGWTVFTGGVIALGEGKNTFSAGSGSDVTIGSAANADNALSGVSSVKIADGAKAGTVLYDGKNTQVYQITTVTLNGNFVQQADMDAAFTVGGYADVAVNGTFGTAADADSAYGISVSIGTNTKFTAAAGLSGISKLEIKNGSGTVCFTGGEEPAAVYGRTVFSAGAITGTMKDNAVSIGENVDFTSKSIDLGAGKKNSFSVKAKSTVRTETLSGIVTATVSAGAKVADKLLEPAEEFHKTDNPKLAVYSFAEVTVDGDYLPQSGVAAAFTLGDYGRMAISGSFGTAADSGTSVTIGKDAVFTVGGDMSAIAKLDVKNGSGAAYYLRRYEADAAYDTFDEHNMGVVRIGSGAGTITGTAGNNTVSIGANVDFAAGAIDLGGGKNTFSVGAASRVNTGTVSGISSATVTGGAGAGKTAEGVAVYSVTVLKVDGSFVMQNGMKNTFTVKNYADVLITGSFDGGDTGAAVSLSKDASFTVSGEMTDIASLTLAAGSNTTAVRQTYSAENGVQDAEPVRNLTVFRAGSITGTAGADKIDIGSYSDFVSGAIDLGGGKNSFTVNAAAEAEVTGTLSGVSTLSVKDGKSLGKYNSNGKQLTKYHFTSVTLSDVEMAQDMASAVSIGKYTEVTVLGGFDGGAGTGITVGTNARFVVNGAMTAVSSLNLANGSGGSYLKGTYNDAGTEKVTSESGVTDVRADSISGTAGNDTVKVGQNVRFAGGSVDLGAGANTVELVKGTASAYAGAYMEKLNFKDGKNTKEENDSLLIGDNSFLRIDDFAFDSFDKIQIGKGVTVIGNADQWGALVGQIEQNGGQFLSLDEVDQTMDGTALSGSAGSSWNASLSHLDKEDFFDISSLTSGELTLTSDDYDKIQVYLNYTAVDGSEWRETVVPSDSFEGGSEWIIKPGELPADAVTASVSVELKDGYTTDPAKFYDYKITLA